MMAAVPVTKPKHFLTFQIVASVQKSGDVVAILSNGQTLQVSRLQSRILRSRLLRL